MKELFSAGGIVMPVIAAASVAAWWLALSCAARTGHLLRALGATRRCFTAKGGAAARAVARSGGATRTLGGPIELASGEMARIEQLLRLLAVLVGVLPLLGLLGTVSGMIGTFGTLHTMGTGDARSLAGGIREALVATEVGLATALPALLLHRILAGRLRRAEGEQEILIHRLAHEAPRSERFGEIATRLGYVSPRKLDRGIALARKRSIRVGEALLAQGCISSLQRRIVLALQGASHD